MKKHKHICKSKQQNRCFDAAQDLSPDESEADDESDLLSNEEPTAMTIHDENARNIFDLINKNFGVI